MTAKEIYERYINLNLSDYSAIGIDLEINKVILLILIGLLISTIVISYKKGLTVRLVKKLLRHEAIGEENAKSLSELRLSSFGIKKELKSNGRLRRMIKIVGEKELSYEEYIESCKKKKKDTKEDTKEDIPFKIYILKEKLNDVKAIGQSKDITVLNTALLCILYSIIFISFIFLMPGILNLINTLLV